MAEIRDDLWLGIIKWNKDSTVLEGKEYLKRNKDIVSALDLEDLVAWGKNGKGVTPTGSQVIPHITAGNTGPRNTKCIGIENHGDYQHGHLSLVRYWMGGMLKSTQSSLAQCDIRNRKITRFLRFWCCAEQCSTMWSWHKGSPTNYKSCYQHKRGAL